jgi:hypothetical protein
MSPRPGRNAAAQAGFPNSRVGWLVASLLLAVLIAAIVILRGAWGPPISRFGAVVRTLGLLFVAAVPAAALAWAWKRLPRRGRRVAPIPIGVLSVLLALLALAHSAIYAERVRMGRDPVRQATASLARGDTTLWAVEDSLGNLLVPPILNRCIINRYGSRVTPGTDGMTVNAAHRRYRRRASERARRYNETIIARLRIPTEQVRQFSDGNNCPD